MNNNKLVKKILTLSSLSMAFLVLSSTVNATQLKEIKQTPAKPLVALDAPSFAVEHQAVHFSQKIAPNSQLSFQAQGFESVSDEYWIEVTGKQLNTGVELAVSKEGALIRLSGKRAKGGFNDVDLAIDPSNVELFKNKQALVQPFKQTVSQQQLATANIFPNSSAMQLNKNVGKGKFTLRVSENLNENQHYMVNVKEKNAEHKLHLSIARQTYIAGENITFNSFINNKIGKLALVNNKAFIKMPAGEKQAVKYAKVNGKFTLVMPSNLAPAKRGELYELLIESQANDNGIQIKRNAKVAFAIAQPTARMQGKYSVDVNAASVNLHIASEGRYEVSGLVYGTAKNGLKVPFMLSRSAYYLMPGEQSVQLQFDQKILKASGLQAPFSVKQLRLMDQSRMALLQQL